MVSTVVAIGAEVMVVEVNMLVVLVAAMVLMVLVVVVIGDSPSLAIETIPLLASLLSSLSPPKLKDNASIWRLRKSSSLLLLSQFTSSLICGFEVRVFGCC